MDQQTTQIAISAFTDPAQTVHPASRVLSWNKAQPSREVSARLIVVWVARTRDHCCRNDHPNSWNSHQAATCVVLTCQSDKFCINRREFCCNFLKLSDQIVQGASGTERQTRIIVIADDINEPTDSMRPCWGYYSELRQMASNAIYQLRPLAEQHFAHPM